MTLQPSQCEMEWKYSWLNDLKDQSLEGSKEEGDFEEGDALDLKLELGGKLW